MDDKPSDKPDRVSFSGSTKMYLWPKVNFVVFWSFFVLFLVFCCCCWFVASAAVAAVQMLLFGI